jgi:hypothetical protein
MRSRGCNHEAEPRNGESGDAPKSQVKTAERTSETLKPRVSL